MKVIDMHIHTTASDGSYSPSEIIRLANKAGLVAVAITDHDTVNGIEEAKQASLNSRVSVIPGIEISVGNSGNIHILGFFIDYKSESILKFVSKLQESRIERNEKMIEKLQNCDFDISIEAVKGFAETENIGRLHIAQYLEKSAQISDYRIIFKKYISKGGKAYVERKSISEKEGIETIINAGGLPFLAHISYFKKPYIEIEEKIVSLKEYGLIGLETVYSNYTQKDISFCNEMCEKYGLLKSGGTDFHGTRRKGVYLGTGRGNMYVPYSFLEDIKAKTGKGL